MIQPIFFPFTHFQASDINAVASLFKSIFFFPASTVKEFEESANHADDKDFLLPIYTEDKDFEVVLQKVKEYRNWGELNKDNQGNLKAFLQEKPYLTGHSGVAHIRAGIKRPPKEIDDVQIKEDSLLKSLMFLRLAKIHDMEKENLYNQLKGIEKDEQQLFSSLHGFDREFDQNINHADKENINLKTRIDDLGEYMTSNRISAWVDFFNRKNPFSSFNSSLLFVTTSPAVMEYLTSIAKNKIKLLDIDNIKVHEKKCENRNQWVETFNKYVESLVISGQQSLNVPAERDDNCALEIKIKLYLLQGDDISSFFQGVGQKSPVCLVSV
ncbi:MAG: hypothetical protein KAJ62_11345 [Desulfobacteraceae bacterium]|nr:hypothetical protein [Desulfobacteraceae bacterium]